MAARVLGRSRALPVSRVQVEKKEEDEFASGPLSVLTMSVKQNTQVRTRTVHFAFLG